MFAPARRFVTASVLSVPSWCSRDEWGAILRSCEPCRPHSEQRPRGEILEAASFSRHVSASFALRVCPDGVRAESAERTHNETFPRAGPRIRSLGARVGREKPRRG